MKKIYLSVFASAVTLTALAQQKNISSQRTVSDSKNHFSNQKTIATVASNSTYAKTQAIVWSDDFSSAATWTATAQAGAGLWSIGTTGTSGTYSIATINSTTKANGFGLFNSDADCSGNEIADLTTVTSINCTGHPFVLLKFQQQYRRFYDSTFIFISNNGTSWTKYTVNKNLKNNDFCPSNPELVSLNITPTAGNQATVWVRFEFYSPSALGAGAGCGYSWMIDDASIVDMPANDMKIDNNFADFGSNFGGSYSIIPKTQVLPVSFGAALSNQGSSAQSNVKLNVNISNGSTSVYNQTSTVIATVAYQHLDTLLIPTPSFTPAAQSLTYTVTYSVSQTAIEAATELLNSSRTQTIVVNDTVFARDNGILTGDISSNYFTGGSGVDASEIANSYEFSLDATASSVSAFIHSSTTNGTSIVANIYLLSPNGSKTSIATSAAYSIAGTANKNKWVTLPLNASLSKDSTYLASILAAGITSTATIVVLGEDKTTFQRPGVSWVNLPGSSTPWGTIAELPMIRLNIKPGFVGINELESKGFALNQNTPNPFSKDATVSYQLIKDANTVTFTVTDVMGRIVSSEKANANTGSHSVKLGSYAPGVYYYTLNVDGHTITKKMIVE
jgi:hypothetical protein